MSGSSGGHGYIHGYSAEEQQRLIEQARFLEPEVFREIDFWGCSHLVEIGCGVGAQAEILLRRFPNIHIHGVDASAAQIEAARSHLAPYLKSGQVQLSVGDALKLADVLQCGTETKIDPKFDSAFICWLLEHVEDPLGILRELRRTLKPGAVLYCTEVMNFSFFVHPYSPATLQYWFAFNDHQWNLTGDPFVGAKLGNLLHGAGYRDIRVNARVYHYDNRMPKQRAAFIEYWTRLLLSGAPALVEAGKVSADVVSRMSEELQQVAINPDSVFFYAFAQARATN